MEKKVCSNCGIELPITDFYMKVDYGKIRYSGRCKKCESANYKSLRLEHQREMEKKESQKKNKDSLDKLNAEAVAHGMSYGKYVAMLEMKKRKE